MRGRAWVAMIRAQAADVKIVLLTPTPDTTAVSMIQTIRSTSTPIRSAYLAAEYHVGLVDSLSLFKQSLHDGGKLSDLMAQANHPTVRA